MQSQYLNRTLKIKEDSNNKSNIRYVDCLTNGKEF